MTAGAARVTLSSASAIAAIAALTARRLMRTRSMLIALTFAVLPVVAAMLLRQAKPGNGWPDVFGLVAAVLAVIAPLCFTSTVAEEIEDRTFTFLWSRPIPRWAILVGKIAGVLPIAGALVVGSALAAFVTYHSSANLDIPALAGAAGAAFVGVLVCGIAASSIGVLIPKHAVAAGVFFLLAIDLPVGSIPFSLARLSITYHARAITGTAVEPESTLATVVWCAVLIAIWGGLGFWRITRSELSTVDK